MSAEYNCQIVLFSKFVLSEIINFALIDLVILQRYVIFVGYLIVKLVCR